jgi:predicted ATPase/class 3 adenylate cyclase
MASPRRAMPTGTLTFLFSDIEGSTRLVESLGTAAYRELLEQHQRLLRSAFAAAGGFERSTEGDSFFVAFRDAPSAIAAAVAAQRALATANWPGGEPVRVRMGLHTGQGIAGGDDYVGLDVHRAARIAAAAHGGQVIVSASTRALTQSDLPSDIQLVDLGEHRLRGVSGTERLYQLEIAGLPSAFPPPRTESVSATHLPPRLTSFVGRDAELAELADRVAASRLVTLTGPGGAGKTSLATECARAVADRFRDGAWFVALDAISDPQVVASAIASALGLREAGDRPAEEQLRDNLAYRELLLVLDNFEQVLPASTVVGAILIAAAGVRVLVTSRAPLHLAAEHVYPVSPLPVPPAVEPTDGAGAPSVDSAALDALLAIPSVQLFVDRAQQVQPSFRLTTENAPAVVDICARLDGLPLGIELAAARIPLLGARGVAERLASQVALPALPAPDAPARQQTLEQAIAWSHDLLDPDARKLFARLSIFSGGWRLDEAEAICGPAAEIGGEVIELLAGLVDQNLVVTREDADGDVRYEILETIRAFAADQLAATGDLAELGRRHAQTYLALAEASAPGIRRRNRVATLRRIAPERDNFRAAARWAIDNDDADTALRLGTALVELRGAPPWGVGAALAEARTTILATLAVPGAEVPTLARMRALEAAGTAFYYIGNMERARGFYESQLAVAEEIDDRQGVADGTFNLAWTTDWSKRPVEAAEYFDRVSDAYRATGDERGLARVSFIRGQVLLRAGQLESAIQVHLDALERYRELDDIPYLSMTTGALGQAYLLLGDRDAAIHWFIDGVFRISREIGDEVAITMTLPAAAMAAIERGRPEVGTMIMGVHEALSRTYGVRPPVVLQLIFQEWDPLERARAILDRVDFDTALERGRRMRLEEVVALIDRLQDEAPGQTDA